MSLGGSWAETMGYRDAVPSNGFLFLSGQVGLEEDGTVPTDPTRQYELAFAAIARLLADHGLSAVDVVDMTSFHTEYPQHMREFMAAKAAFQGEARPAWTAVGVAKLGLPDTLVEIKVTAQFPTA